MNNRFASMCRKDLKDFIYYKKRELGQEVTVFAHNFTAEDIIPFADVVGDSLTLSKATRESRSRFLLFTAAKFFTEVACILVPQKEIIQANLQANCPLTYTIDEEVTRKAFETIMRKCSNKDVIPIAYFTASYQIKSLCGEYNGTVCTASNATELISHFLKQNKSVFFTPMNNVAFNVIKELGIRKDDVLVLDQDSDLQNISGNQKIFVWNVGCYVHSDFRVSDIAKIRKKYEKMNIRIVAHLECLPDVIEMSDYACFTDDMHRLIRDAQSGTCWGIATTHNFVTRIANTYTDKTIVSIRPDLICLDMAVTDLIHVAESFQSIVDYKNGIGKLKHRLHVPERYQRHARKALETMFEINRRKNIVEEIVRF